MALDNFSEVCGEAKPRNRDALSTCGEMLQEEEGKIELGSHSPLTALGFVEADAEALVKAAEEV